MAPESSAKIKHFKPYFSPAEVERLSTKQRGKLSVSREEKVRLQACGFIEGVGVRCGFPRKTISTAQTLYMRFHLFFPYKDFNHIDVSLSVLHVSAKLHDTLKKPCDIILASYAIRYPHLVKKGQVDASSVDPRVIEEERKKVLGIERLVLETMCFKFEVDEVGPYVLKISRRLRLDRKACKAAWSIAVDCHRTPAPLSFPPHVIALGSIYVAALLSLESPVPLSNSDAENRPVIEPGTWEYVVETLSKSGLWEEEYFASANQVDDITHYLLDLYTTLLSTPLDPSMHPSPVSPKEPKPSPSTSTPSLPLSAYRLTSYWTPQTLTELKIHLRNRRPGKPAVTPWPNSQVEDESQSAIEGVGQNEGTVRFVWDSIE